MSESEIAVFLFTGFLDSGKTTFIQKIMESRDFNDGVPTLILMCEEGEEELDMKKFTSKKVSLKHIESPDDLDAESLERVRRVAGAQRVMIEYNGMWELADFLREMPDNWVIYQEFTFADARTYSSYYANMRNLVVDKLKNVDVITFTKMEPETDKMPLHKIVRSVGRSIQIAYDYGNGHIEADDIVDPLPFDINAPIIRINDTDYGLWYADMTENLKKYDGKKVSFKAILGKDKTLGKNEFFAGRHVMTCCANDIQYAGVLCIWDNADTVKMGDWADIVAKIKVERQKVYGGKGPVLYVTAFSKTQAPEEQVVTFTGQ